MTESNYEYTFEAEKNQSTQPGFKPFDTLKEALNYMEDDGVLRAGRITKIFPDFEYRLDKEYLDFV